MSNNLRQDIYQNLDQKETAELVEMWLTNDRFEWTDLTFEVIHDILQERIGELPPQNEPVLDHDEVESDDEAESDYAPVFYKPKNVAWLEKWLTRASILYLVIFTILNFMNLPDRRFSVMTYFQNAETSVGFLPWLIAVILVLFSIAVEVIIVYLPLKALAYILNILMEMEFTSRGVKAKLPGEVETPPAG